MFEIRVLMEEVDTYQPLEGIYLTTEEETIQYRYITHSGEWSEWREAEYVRSTE